jgi:transposase
MALNRKNALFAGSDGGAEHWSVIASLIETCKLNGVNPYAYLATTITKIVNGHPNGSSELIPAAVLNRKAVVYVRLDELLPWAYPMAPALGEGGEEARAPESDFQSQG